jgi:hypothetical protein
VEDFSWTAGQELVSYYDASAYVQKTFCKTCGSNLITIYPGHPDIYGVAVGGITGDLGNPKALHVYVGSKADWYEISDDVEQYDELPADVDSLHRVDV